MRKRLLNKLGMTYIELLVALALLSLIIVSFTPMLMSSYENLYKAGERVETVYKSQQEMEEGLALRGSQKEGSVPMTFVMNAEKLFENMNVNGRKVVSTLQDKFETIFYGVRARIDFLSPDVVYDDSSSHEVVLQTTGLNYDEVIYISKYSGKLEDLPENKIIFGVYIPNKATGNEGSTTDELVYQSAAAIDQSLISCDLVNGRIKFTISGTDFTLSPVKILVYYKNERGILKTLSRYLTIEPPTIIMAGTSAVFDYYTTAGIEEKDASTSSSTQSVQYQFKLEGRTMRTSNSAYLTNTFGSPKNTGSIIRNVTWVSNDEAAGIAPYYVMVGTNGAIYRMYNYTSHNTDIYNLSSGKSSGYTPVDNTYDTSEGTRIYSSLWSGDKSHVFDFSSWDRSMNYGLDEEGGNDNCWLTAEQYTVKKGQTIAGFIPISKDTVANTNRGAEEYNLFGMRAKFSYYLNGYRVGFSYKYQSARNMSYIITEYGSPLRAFGFLKNESDYKGFTEIWYPSGTYSVISRNKSVSDLNTIVVFDGTTGGGDDGGRHNETAFASLRYTNLGSYNPNSTATVDYTLVNFMRTDGSATSDREQARQITGGYDSLHGRESEINITDAIYIPSAGSVAGSMFYIGNVHAYMNIMQKDNINSEANVASTIYNRAKNKDYDPGEYAPHGALTDYVVYGNAEGTGTTVHKYSSGTVGEVYVNLAWLVNTETGVERSNTNGVSAAEKQAKMQEGTDYMPTGDARRHFFVARDTNQWKGMFMNDVLFTMGYSSNREKVYTNITYDGQREYYRSYEHLYFLSHYGVGGVNTDGTPIKVATRATVGSATNRNVYNNDYYNVWFPGEMYNLSKVASKDGVTVAVGYAVAGSAYQWINNAQTTNTSTALGGIYNDGVLAAMVEGKHSEFTNLLYFKDNASFNATYLTSGWPNSDYKNAFGTYGTHERDSVQFTAVDINVENDSKADDATSQTRRYYAYYGDNKGRLFRSLVATSTVSVQSGTGEEIVTSQDINLVSFIADTTYAGTTAAPARMDEIKIGNTKSLSDYFSQIVTIDAQDDIIVVSGSPKTASTRNCVVVGTMDENGAWSWKVVYLGGFQGFPLYASKIVGGYYYSAGQNWAGAVNLETLKEVGAETVLPPRENTSETKNAFIYVGVADQIYAMDGRETN
ncbi:MAG: hypothetical protein J6A43_02575 [Clostridia bacterium]|nr:hypothetical protein [Clostridia bacterium]